ncbi:hypothetical protein HDU99_010673, partial [Rhizoclosmatium hyalinum]
MSERIPRSQSLDRNQRANQNTPSNRTTNLSSRSRSLSPSKLTRTKQTLSKPRQPRQPRTPANDPLRPFTFKYPLAERGALKALAQREFKRWSGILPNKSPRKRALPLDTTSHSEELPKQPLRMAYFDDDERRDLGSLLRNVESLDDWTSVFAPDSRTNIPESPRKVARVARTAQEQAEDQGWISVTENADDDEDSEFEE